MRKMLCVLAVLLTCMKLTVPVMAASDTFVPSISYKNGPEIVDAVMNEENVGDCIIVSSIKQAQERTTDIYQEDRDLLLEVYEKLEDGSMELPLEDTHYVVRELVDVSFIKMDCVEDPHDHKQWLAQDDTTVTIRFDLNVLATTDVTVLVYLDGEWVRIENVVNNGDGTITCEFEDICPVAFCVDPAAEQEPPKTGDVMGQGLLLWIILLISSAVVLVLLIKNRKKLIK